MKLVDTHHHFLPPDWIAAAREHKPSGNWPPKVALWSPQRSLEAMDAHGISNAVVSLGLPGVFWGEAAGARRWARTCNEFAAGMRRDHPARFGFFATLALPDIDDALAELAYALDVLGADGVGLLTSYEDRWQGDASFDRLYAELDRRGATVFVHPTVPACCRGLFADVPPSTVEYLFDTTRAIVNLAFTGTLDRYPRINFIFSHAGGALPMAAARVEHIVAESEKLSARLPQGPGPLFARLFFDVATSLSKPTFGALRAFTTPDRLLFGSDFPYVSPSETVPALHELDADDGVRDAIAYRNAFRLFPRLAAMHESGRPS
jgi:predicted TIM-barrel fold metal-dependent hydrolase